MNWVYAWLVLLLSTGCTAHLEKRVALLETQVAELRNRVPSGKFSELGTGEPHGPMLATRGGTGTYSLYGAPVIGGATIPATYWNNTLADLATEMTDSLSRSGKGGMLAPLVLTVGSVTSPSLYFSGDVNTGLYWVSADDFAVTVGGTKVLEFGSTGVVNTTTNGDGLVVTANGTGAGIRGNGGTTNSTGVVGTGAGNGDGVVGTGNGSGAGVRATGGATGTGIVASGGATSGTALQISTGNAVTPQVRFTGSAAPSGAALVGDMYMTTVGVLKVCVTAGTPCASWVSVGTQT